MTLLSRRRALALAGPPQGSPRSMGRAAGRLREPALCLRPDHELGRRPKRPREHSRPVLLPFWRGVADSSAGEGQREGYALNHDLAGRWLGPANLAVVTQARMLWFFAHLQRHGRATPDDAGRAERGYAVLTKRFRDKAQGGFFWQVRYTDYGPSKPDKQLYGQIFPLFALSEHALATGSDAATAAAADAFKVIDSAISRPRQPQLL